MAVDGALWWMRFGVLLLLLGPVVESIETVPLKSAVEKSALLSLRASLGVRARDWPKLADPCSAWAGIGCRNGSVVGVSLYGLTRTKVGASNPRFDVESLVNLTALEVFNSSGFALPGVIPEWFGQRLGALQVLDLRSSSVVGSIPESLGGLKELNALVLSANMIDGGIPVALGNLSRLEVLDLSHNKLVGSVPLAFQFWSNLTHMDLSSNSLSGPLSLGLSNLSRLKYLNLSSNGFTASVPAQLGNITELVELDLGWNLFSGALPGSLTMLKRLRKLSIGNNDLEGQLSDDEFLELQDLEFLDLSGNRFEGSFPSTLLSLPKLTFFDVSGNKFTGTLTGLTSNVSASNVLFNLSNNLLYGGLVSQLGKYSALDLSGNYFAGKVPSDAVNSHSILIRNCLQSVASQRRIEDCRFFYSQRGLSFDSFGALSPTQPPMPEPSPKSSRHLPYILAGVFGGTGFIVIVAVVLLCIFKTRNKGHLNLTRSANVGPIPDDGMPSLSKSNASHFGESFTFDRLVQMTGNFSESNLIKHGHSGDLYRGVLDDGIHVVIKKTNVNAIKKEPYLSELDFLSKVSHTRLIPFLGHCLEHDSTLFLVYKYMPNSDLSNALNRKTKMEDGTLQSLDWITRSKIAIGAAEGLCFLHHECTSPVVHRDVQSTSILLDDKFEVHLGSLSEVHVQEGEAQQNVITRLWRSSRSQSFDQLGSGSPAATCDYDVYCFGKVLLELVTGQVGMSNAGEAATKQWLEQTLPYISIREQGHIRKTTDSSLVLNDDHLDEVWSMAIVARTCLNPKPSKRPSVRHVLQALENPLKLVRDEQFSSARFRNSSSRHSWTAAFFGSWRQGSTGSTVLPEQTYRDEHSSMKQSDSLITQGSIRHYSSSRKRQPIEIFPEPFDSQDLERA